MFCHKCGTQLPETLGFCHKCGARIGDNQPASQSVSKNEKVRILTCKPLIQGGAVSGSVELSDGVLRVSGNRLDRNSDGSFDHTVGERELPLVTVKDVVMKKLNAWGMLVVALFLIITPIVFFFILELDVSDIFESINSIIFLIGIPIVGLISMYQYLINRGGCRVIISHANGETEVYVRRAEINTVEALANIVKYK